MINDNITLHYRLCVKYYKKWSKPNKTKVMEKYKQRDSSQTINMRKRTLAEPSTDLHGQEHSSSIYDDRHQILHHRRKYMRDYIPESVLDY